MTESIKMLNETSHLLLHRTGRKEIKKGISVIVRGEGVRVFDQDGKSYIDLEAGGTRPVHAGYGRKELAQAGYDHYCAPPPGRQDVYCNVHRHVLCDLAPTDFTATYQCRDYPDPARCLSAFRDVDWGLPGSETTCGGVGWIIAWTDRYQSAFSRLINL